MGLKNAVCPKKFKHMYVTFEKRGLSTKMDLVSPSINNSPDRLFRHVRNVLSILNSA